MIAIAARIVALLGCLVLESKRSPGLLLHLSCLALLLCFSSGLVDRLVCSMCWARKCCKGSMSKEPLR
eukprot:s10_g7.t1